MKNKTLLILLSGIVFTGLLINSCKKDNSGSIQNLFTGGHWQLASVTRYHFYNTVAVSTDTLNTLCNNIQLFTFNTDNTCTYTNFDCLPQPVATGTWGISADQLTLNSNITCQDTTAQHASQPFINAEIINLGQYSLVLRTGQYASFYYPNQNVVFTDFGFVRVK